MQKFIMTAFGQDHPGIVSAVTEVLFQTGCNLEDSSMTILEDQFTMLFIFHPPAKTTVDALSSQLRQVLADAGLQGDIRTIDTSVETTSRTGQPWMITVSGPDQTGIMYHVTQYLGASRINIRQLTSKRLTRADGNSLFLMALEVDTPDHLPEAQLTGELAELALREGLDIHAELLETYTL